MGYLPHISSFISEETFLRSLIHQYKSGGITKSELLKETHILLLQIRNNDIHYGEWLKKGDLDKDDINNYETRLSPYKNKARDRMGHLLGYSPELKYSYHAELILREFLKHDKYWDDKWYHFDYKCYYIVRYRELFYTQGKEAADKLELLGCGDFLSNL